MTDCDGREITIGEHAYVRMSALDVHGVDYDERYGVVTDVNNDDDTITLTMNHNNTARAFPRDHVRYDHDDLWKDDELLYDDDDEYEDD